MIESGKDWMTTVFEEALANLEAKEAKKRPVTVQSYFDVLMQLDDVRRDLINFGGKYGATRFGGPFDLRKVMMAYMSDPQARAEINRIAGGASRDVESHCAIER